MHSAYVGVQTAEKHIKYDHQKPAGIAQILFCVIAGFLLVFIQNALFISGGPNLVLVFALLIATKGRPNLAIAFAAVSGFTIDLVFGRYLGFYGLLFMVAAIGTAFLRDKLETKPRVIAYAVPVLFVFNLLESFLTRVLAVLFGGSSVLYTSFGANFVRVILPGFLYDTVTLLIFIFPVYILWRRLTPH